MLKDASEKPITAALSDTSGNILGFTELRAWIIGHLAAHADVAPSTIDPAERFQRLGLNSIGATAMLIELGGVLGRQLSPTLVWEYPTPEALAHYLDPAEVTTPAAVLAKAQSRTDDEPIAIVGMACRFPQAPTPQAFWRLLRDGVDAISEVPAGRWSEEVLGASGVEPAERTKVRRGGFLDQIDGFDPLFFGISPREAIAMDPQQRLLLELVWEALEGAGIPPSSLKESRTAVFAASIWMDYGILLHRGGPAALGAHTITGYHHAILANRISYLFGLQGPSFTIDSACSSGLVSTHLACQSLRHGESTMALVAAANLNVLPESALGVSRFGALSPDGRCYTFDARANGYVRGEGAAVLVLKTLSRAIADGDAISCVIRGSAVNNDGPSNGLTAPNPRAQEALLREAYRRAGVSPAEVQYVEAHGTGTPLGDPIEARALGAVLGVGRAADRPLLIGSAKTNVGHLEGAAGLVGLIKVAQSIEHRLLPPSLHFVSANPHAPLAELGLAVPTTLGPWPAPSQRLTAGVSSFGLGGTNGHVVVQQWPAAASELFTVGAATPEALSREVEAQRAKLASDAGHTPLGALCADAAKSAGQAAVRVAVVARTHEELGSALATFLRGGASSLVHTSGPLTASRGVVFVFPGQGAQWHGMALSLLHGEPVFRSTLERCDQYVRKYLGWSLIEELIASRQASRLGDIEVSLPAIIAIDIAVATYYRSLGIEPAAVVGHSTGEIAAAYVAGALDLEDTMRIICAYGRIIGRCAGRGSMALVGLPWEQAAQALVGCEGRVFRAIQDSATATVLAGEPAALAAVLARLRGQGVFCRAVAMNVSPHCPLVDALRDELLQALQGIRPRRCSVPLISEVTGREIDGTLLEPAHWVRNFGDPAFFSSAIDELIGRGHRVFVDVGPHPITKHSIEANLARAGVEGLVLSSLRHDEDERGTLLEALGKLYALGAPLRLGELYPQASELGRADAAWLLPLSARSPEALAALAAAYDEFLMPGAGSARLRDIVYTASVRRDHHAHRLAVVGRTREELRAALQMQLERASHSPTEARPGYLGVGAAPKVVFVFSGQGSQWLGMGQTLLVAEPVFRDAIASCDQAIQAEAGFSVLAELAADQSSSQLARIDVVQPVLFAMAVGLAALWRSWGVRPDAVVGHSLGEVAAAHVAGALSLADAVAVVCRRSRLLRRISGQGEMAMVELSLAEAEGALSGYEARLSVAVSNGPRSTVLAGEPAALAEVLGRLEQSGVFCRRVKVDVASHSPQVEPLRAELLAALAELAPREATVPMHSTVLSAEVKGPELLADYWVDNLRQPVRFGDAVQKLVESGHGLFIEVSPHPILVPAVADLRQAAQRDGAVVGSLRRGQPERAELFAALGELWGKGCPVAWEALFPTGGRRVALPTYPWQRQRYWVETAANPTVGPSFRVQADGHPLLGAMQTLSTQLTTHLWETALDLKSLPWLDDHRVQGAVIFPGAAYVEMALCCGVATFGEDPFAVTDLTFVEALALAADTAVSVQGVTTEEQPGQQSFQVATQVSDAGRVAFRVHARAKLRRAERAEVPARTDLAAVRARLQAGDAAQLYSALAEMGLTYGPAFQGITELWHGEAEALGRVQLPQCAGSPAHYQFHPALLDACFQVMMAAGVADGKTTPWVPVEVGSLRLLQRPAGELWCHARLAPTSAAAPERRHADLWVVDSAGAAVAAISGLTVQQLASSARRGEQDDWFVALNWERAPVPAQKLVAGRWLLLGGDPGLGAALRSALEAAGHAVVHAAEKDPGLVGLRTLLTEAFAGKAPTAVVHLDSLAGDAQPDTGTTEQALVQSCDSALCTVQALAGMEYRDAPRLWLVTRGAQAAGRGAVAVAQAPLVGLGRVIALEHAELRCGLLDLDPARPAGEVEALLAELLADDAEEEIAWRGGERRVARLVPWRPTARREIIQSADPQPVVAIHRDASYLVTGGLGGLGLSVAGWLAERGAGQLVLVGRRGVVSAEQKDAVAALAKHGTRVTVAQADVANRAQLEQLLGELTQSGMPLRGIVHAAGLLDDGLLLQQTPARFRAVMAPKILGAFNLHELTRALTLDFFVLYSSAAGLLGSPAQGSYAAANTFLDALAHSRRAQGLPAVSISWGAFSTVGLAAQADRGARLASRGMRSMTPGEGLVALERLLAENDVQVGVVPLNLRQWVGFNQAAASSRRLSRLWAEQHTGLGQPAGDRSLLHRLAAAAPAARAALLEEVVRAQVALVLRLPQDKLDVATPLTSLGMDSLMGLELRSRIETVLGIKVSATLLWAYPTVASLAAHLANQSASARGGAVARAPIPDAPVPEDDEVTPLDDQDALFALLDESLTRAGKGVMR